MLPCGPIPPNPSEAVGGKRFAQVLDVLRRAYDRIVIDSPPVMSVTDGRVLAATSDASILVVRMNKSTRKAGALALEGLHNVGAKVLGVVVNDMPRSQDSYGYYTGYSRYGIYGAAPRGAGALDGGTPGGAIRANGDQRTQSGSDLLLASQGLGTPTEGEEHSDVVGG